MLRPRKRVTRGIYQLYPRLGPLISCLLCLTAVAAEDSAGAPDALTSFPATSFQELHRPATHFRTLRDPSSVNRLFREGILLVKRHNAAHPEALHVPAGREGEILGKLRTSAAYQYVELDLVLLRQFASNDPGILQQWHHATIHSSDAWSISLATHRVTLAILDTPFQMNHPDLARNSVAGWNMLTGTPITGDDVGYYHSTICAGLAAAVINNGLGVSGVANCLLMPIDIGDNPTTSGMHDAILWAADHGVRVVNLSWDGAFSSVINDAGAYLKQKNGGMLFMSGVNGRKLLNYPNQPDIYAISMTDRDDRPRSAYGDHIDFAAPGWEVYSTTTNSTYEADSGTSYSTPLVAGLAAWMMSVNPALGPPEIESILKQSSLDLGDPGWDQTFGWGRVDFGLVARNTFATLPVSRIAVAPGLPFVVHAVPVPGAKYRLWRATTLNAPQWELIPNVRIETQGNSLTLSDPDLPAAEAFYQVEITLPAE